MGVQYPIIVNSHLYVKCDLSMFILILFIRFVFNFPPPSQVVVDFLVWQVFLELLLSLGCQDRKGTQVG